MPSTDEADTFNNIPNEIKKSTENIFNLLMKSNESTFNQVHLQSFP